MTTKPLYEVELKNLIEQAESEIKEMLDSNMTSYEIGKRSGISNQVIDRYRKGTNAIENMTFKTAKKLLKLKEEEMKMTNEEFNYAITYGDDESLISIGSANIGKTRSEILDWNEFDEDDALYRVWNQDTQEEVF